MGRLQGKTVLITGAARGIGASAARIFAREGARLILGDRLEEPLQALARELGATASYRLADITDEPSVRRLVEETVRSHGRIDAALLNAGIAGNVKPLEEISLEEFEQVMAVNVRGVWLGLKYLMKAMGASGGSIVITASAAGVRATPNMSAYIASKHAAIGLMRAAAIEGAARGIRVNTVNPATIDTPMVEELGAKRIGGIGLRVPVSYMMPLGRQGTADEVAQMMLFLASDESSFCTGGVYMVDGGACAGRVF